MTMMAIEFTGERKRRKQQTQLWLEPELRSALTMVEVEAHVSMGAVVRNAVLYFMEREYPHCLVAAGIVPRAKSKQRVIARAM